MSWTHFLFWLGAAYALYYSLNLAYDRSKSFKNSEQGDQEGILYYSAEEPVLLEAEPAENQVIESPALVTPLADYLSSGTTGSTSAVSLNYIQELARQELIEYKKKIPY